MLPLWMRLSDLLDSLLGLQLQTGEMVLILALI